MPRWRGLAVRSRACCGTVPVPTGDSPAATVPAATTASASAAAPTTIAPLTASAAVSTASAASDASVGGQATGTRNLFIVLVLAGVLLPVPAGPLSLLVATFVALRSRMRPWIPALLVAGAIALTAPALTR